MDTVSLHQAGVTNAVGISGTALTKEHASYLKRLTNKIFLCLDSDDAGTKATFASIEALANEDFEVRIIRIPSGKDPDEFVKNGGDFDELQKKSLSVVEFFISEGGRKYDLS
ncbi:MAG: primase [Patescibacteria group bacterium]|nr:primase [Patescibacteria group bacterium]